MIKDIALFILSHSGLPWTLGENFFTGHLPLRNALGQETPVRAMALLERVPGAVTGYLPDYAGKSVQVWNRAANYFEAADDALEIYLILHGASGIDLPDPTGSGSRYHAMTIDADGSPAPIANPDINGHYVFSTNYIVRIEGEPPTP